MPNLLKVNLSEPHYPFSAEPEKLRYYLKRVKPRGIRAQQAQSAAGEVRSGSLRTGNYEGDRRYYGSGFIL
ncbi:hypothetical protein [Paenibacillus sp. HB172176]|uniref:hypothetical protein n=1 Tax=Paenibacillus sp. HB172176 TaxID=2493690 RepID=UPI00143A167D|nr:hypothetical protein [Paenibacillus sp. HB172176]